MSFDRRRFLTIASAAVSSLFIPLATHGSATEIVASVSDRYALMACAWRDALDVLPSEYWGDGLSHAREKMAPDVYDAVETVFNQKAETALGLTLDHFDAIPTKEQVNAMFAANVSTMDEERLRLVSERMVPITTVRHLIAVHGAPLHSSGASFKEFARRYKPVLLG